MSGWRSKRRFERFTTIEGGRVWINPSSVSVVTEQADGTRLYTTEGEWVVREHVTAVLARLRD